jgi:hypothetical protein
MSMVRCLSFLAVSVFVGTAFAGCASGDGGDGEDNGEAAAEIRSTKPITGKQTVGAIFKTTADGLRLRSAPKVAVNVIDVLPTGTQVKLLVADPTGTYYNVEVVTSKKHGWVDGGYLIADTATIVATTGSCTALSTCCDDLKKAGFSDTECRKTVSAGNDASCLSTQQRHMSMGDCKAPASGSNPAAGACVALTKCCDDLKKAGFTDSDCRTTVTAGNDAACLSQHQREASMGDCMAPQTAQSGSGKPATGACLALTTCCDDLKKVGYDDSTCRKTVSAGDDAACLSQHQREASFGDCMAPAGSGSSSGTTTTPTGACLKLSTCCSDLKKAGLDDSTCQGVVKAGDDAACLSQHQREASFGDCTAP